MKKAVTGNHVPSYTSIDHIWHGNNPNLNKNPKIVENKPNPLKKSKPKKPCVSKISLTHKKSKDPDVPYIQIIPNNISPEANEPIIKYLVVASIEF